MFLNKERKTLETIFPGLNKILLKTPLMEMESPVAPSNSSNQGNKFIKLFGEFGGTNLLIPEEYGGIGASPLQAIYIQRALGSYSPSLAVATTMHHFTTAIIQEMIPNKLGFDLLKRVAEDRLYFASGFAEGRTGKSIFESKMQVKSASGGIVISGSKKPCSLSMSMDLMTASLVTPKQDKVALVVIPADSPGIERHSFWKSLALSATETHEVKLNNVFVSENNIYNMGNPNQMDKVVAQSFVWFELLASAAYLGIASSLVERIFTANKGNSSERVVLATELEGAMSALKGLACSMMNNEINDSIVAQALFVRYLVQGVIERTTIRAAEILGGMAFVKSPDVSYLLASARALAFHPPSRLSTISGLDKYLFGQPLHI